MIKLQKTVAAVHDISCFGKCSLTVALPIISAAGITCAVVPTAVLSTHTGGFAGYTYRDLTDDIDPIFAHWRELDLRFDAVYSGFLGSPEQLSIVARLFAEARERGAVVIVDPVMADNGELYATFDRDFPRGMRALCEGADIIVPNTTEAALMLNEPCVTGAQSAEYVEGLLRRLAALPSRYAVLTGVERGELLGAAYIDVATGEIGYAMGERIPGSYHGTGDVFASTLTAALTLGREIGDSLQIAVDFTVEAIKKTRDAGTPARNGVNFEAGLGRLAARLGGE
ncbi:MAG: pyridoxamine kinase [Oscillospiraceae bacterium]|jgi:pyridoxine kinase|nr:pyridoxamine kinase [Oscillospiraceae bacterium]